MVGQTLVKVLVDPLQEPNCVHIYHLIERVRLHLLQLSVAEVVQSDL